VCWRGLLFGGRVDWRLRRGVGGELRLVRVVVVVVGGPWLEGLAVVDLTSGMRFEICVAAALSSMSGWVAVKVAAVEA
jgi:hypothetical protein